MKKKRLIALLTVLLLLAFVLAQPGLAQDVSGGAGEEARFYYYNLACIDDGVSSGTVKLNLSVRYNSVSQPGTVLDAGAFGLRFPKWVKSAVFTPTGSDAAIQRIVSTDRYPYKPDEKVLVKDSYIAFAWFRQTDEWHYNTDGAYVHLDLGTFTLTLPQAGGGYQLPSKTAVGQLDWSKADEAAKAALGGVLVAADEQFDRTLWNPDTGCYQGYYTTDGATAADVESLQTDLRFPFTAPAAWPNALTVLSYAPAKPMTVKLFTADGATLVADGFSVPRWTADVTKDTGALFAATALNQDSGVGAYYAAVDLSGLTLGNTDVTLTVGTQYRLQVSKPGHLTQNLLLKTAAESTDIAEATGFPEDGEALYLPAGDINPRLMGSGGEAVAVYGDGRINMADRAALLGALGLLSGPDNGSVAWYADLDGDGRVTMADLSILMSPMNYAQHTG